MCNMVPSGSEKPINVASICPPQKSEHIYVK